MTNKLDTSQWPTLPEVSQILGRSAKTIDRYVREGKLRKELRPVSRRKPIPVFDPRHIQRMQEELASGDKTAENAMRALDVNERDKQTPGLVVQALGTLAERLQHSPPPAASAELAQALQLLAETQQNMAVTFARALEMIAQGMSHRNGNGNGKALAAPAALTLTMDEAVAYSGLADSHLRRLIRQEELRNFGTRRDPRLSRAHLDRLAAAKEEERSDAAGM